MLIDWFTVGAQAVNFIILVWLLKRFLYKPILDAVDARERRIAAELADADAKKAQAQKERDEFLNKSEAFDLQRAALLTQAEEEAKVERQRLLIEARQAADALSLQRQDSLQNEAHNLTRAIGERVQHEVFAIARKTLKDLASATLEERIGEAFVRRLRELEGSAKATVVNALKTASAPLVVRSAFDLPLAQRANIQKALEEISSGEVHLKYETAPELFAGVELASNGQKVCWSIADYLVSLESEVTRLLHDKDKPEVGSR